MNVSLIFLWVYLAMLATAFWESYVEGRYPWNYRKEGWKIRIGKTFVFSAYHFFLFWITFPLLISLPLVTHGWDLELFGILISAYFSGIVIEDFLWFVVNPAVKLREFWSDFSDFYPWIVVRGHKIVPVGYIIGILIALLSWFFLWK